MTVTNFKKASDPNPGDSGKYGAPDIKYAFDVLDGTHPTDRVQINNIEGFDKLPSPQWMVRKKPSDTTVIEILSMKTGLITFSGSELYDLFNSLTASSDFVDGHNIVIRASTDGSAYNAGESQANFTKDVNIFGYGATIKGGTTAHPSGGALKQTVHNKYLKVYGLTFDSTDTTNTTKKLGTFVGGGSSVSDITLKLCIVKDCRFLNMLNYGINIQAADNGTDAAPDEATLIVDNCTFDTGTTSDSTNEHILTNAFKYVRISNCSFYGNKVGYISAENVSVNNCFSDTNGRTEGDGLGVHAVNTSVVNMNMRGGGLSFRPFTSVHWGTNWAPNKRVTVRGYTNNRITTSYNAFELTGLDSTYIMGQCTLEDFYIGTGSAVNAVLNQSPTHSRILGICVRNGYIANFDTNNTIANIVDHSVDFMVIANIKNPSYPTLTDNSPVRILANQSTSDIDYLNIKDTFPLPTVNIINQSISSTFNSTVKCATPLQNGVNASRALGAGSGTRTLQFFNNRGKATLSGDGSTLTFNIPHGLVSTPSYVQVTAGSTQANRDFHITSGSTNITVNFATAPANASNNVVLYWNAVAS